MEPGYTYPPDQVEQTTTNPAQPPATTGTEPAPHIERHAVTTNQEPPVSWPGQEWPPVDLPELEGFTVRDQLPPQQPDPLETSYDLHNVQYNDYDQPDQAGDQYA